MTAALLAICIVLDVARELCFKAGAEASSVPTAKGGVTLSKPAIGWPLLGGIIWGIEILCWAGVLAVLPVTIAFPIMSLTYAATPLAGALFRGETISRRRWAGIALVTTGAMIIGASGIG